MMRRLLIPLLSALLCAGVMALLMTPELFIVGVAIALISIIVLLLAWLSSVAMGPHHADEEARER